MAPVIARALPSIPQMPADTLHIMNRTESEESDLVPSQGGLGDFLLISQNCGIGAASV
jgi:hypothetical protein